MENPDAFWRGAIWGFICFPVVVTGVLCAARIYCQFRMDRDE